MPECRTEHGKAAVDLFTLLAQKPGGLTYHQMDACHEHANIACLAGDASASAILRGLENEAWRRLECSAEPLKETYRAHKRGSPETSVKLLRKLAATLAAQPAGRL